MLSGIYKFFDKIEDKLRSRLSHRPIIYGFIGGIAVVLFWRGVWHFADEIQLNSIWSIIIGAVTLLSTGLLASVFIGDQIILSGLRQEKKVSDKTEQEVLSEKDMLEQIQIKMVHIEKMLQEYNEAKRNGKS